MSPFQNLHQSRQWRSMGATLSSSSLPTASTATNSFSSTKSYFQSTAKSPRDYVVLNNWDFVAFASGLGVRFARTVNTAAAFDAALTNAAAFNGPALIAAQVDPHGLPAELP